MWKCPRCGHENEFLFCSECGTKRPEQAENINPSVSRAQSQSFRPQQQQPVPGPAPKEKNNGVLYVIIGILIAALAISAYMFLKKDEPKIAEEEIEAPVCEEIEVPEEKIDPEDEIREYISDNFNSSDISFGVFDLKTEKYYLSENYTKKFEAWGFYLPVALAHGEYLGRTSDTFLDILSHDAGICNSAANKAIDEIGGLSELNGVLRSDFGCSKTSYGRKFGDVRSTEKNYTTASEAVSLLEEFYRKYGSYDLNYDMAHFGIRPPSDTTVHSQIGTENISVKNMLNFFGTVKGRNSEYIVVVLTKNKAGSGSNMTDILSGIHKIMEEASL